MNLTRLNCANNEVADLQPLAGMPLEELNCSYTGVSRPFAHEKSTNKTPSIEQYSC